ncbi:class I SAM-dependent methyltransferase, partial [Rhodopirellula sp.]|nr:class I SAM-dependent methyltransferase [Rhodopirellula sp.]
MKQNEIFKQSEGDRWLHRNRESVIKKQYPECDDIASTIQHLNLRSNSRILEIGCGYPERLGWLTRAGFSCSGIDPSSEAIAAAEQLGVDGT